MTRLTRFTAGALAASLVLAACGDDSDDSDGEDDATEAEASEGSGDEEATGGDLEGGELVLYSGRNEELIQPLVDQFEEETGISVDVRYDGSAESALAIQTEAEAGELQADVFLSQSPGAVGFLAEQGTLGELPEDVLGLVEEDDAASDGTWVGVSGRLRVLVYNTDEVDEGELPDSVLDMTDEEWEGRFGVAPTNGSFQDFVTVMRTELGEDETLDWLEGVADNNPGTFENNTSIVEATARGEVEMGLVNHYYLYAMLDEDPDLPVANHNFAEGDLGSSMLSAAVTMLDGAENEAEAVAFIEYLLSDAGQEYFTDETFEYPLAVGAEPNPALPPLDELEITRVDFSTLGGELQETIDLIDESGL
jgi:iron(III) transport system substrate-binding protein